MIHTNYPIVDDLAMVMSNDAYIELKVDKIIRHLWMIQVDLKVDVI